MILLLAACTQTVHFPDSYYGRDSGIPTGDSGFVPPAPPSATPTIQRTSLSYGCNGAGTGYLASFRTTAWSGSATVLLVDGTNHERHPLRLEDASVDGLWDRYALGPLLTDDDTLPGATTRFPCSRAGQLGWVAWTTTRTGIPADCVAWGPERSALFSALASVDPQLEPLCAYLGILP